MIIRLFGLALVVLSPQAAHWRPAAIFGARPFVSRKRGSAARSLFGLLAASETGRPRLGCVDWSPGALSWPGLRCRRSRRPRPALVPGLRYSHFFMFLASFSISRPRLWSWCPIRPRVIVPVIVLL